MASQNHHHHPRKLLRQDTNSSRNNQRPPTSTQDDTTPNTTSSGNREDDDNDSVKMNTYTIGVNDSLRMRDSLAILESAAAARQPPSSAGCSTGKVPISGRAQHRHHHQAQSPRSQIPGNAQPDEVDGQGQIGPYDVLCGRHKHAFRNVGNRRFRVTVSMNLSRYTAAPTKGEKSKVILSVIDMIHAVGGRFLKWSAKRRQWVELDDKQTREKVGHALRDMAVTRAAQLQSSSSGKLNKDRRVAVSRRKLETEPDAGSDDGDDADDFSAFSASSDGFEDTSDQDFQDLSSTEALNDQKPAGLPVFHGSRAAHQRKSSSQALPWASLKLNPDELQDLVLLSQVSEPDTAPRSSVIERRHHHYHHSLLPPCQDLFCGGFGGASPAAAHGLLSLSSRPSSGGAPPRSARHPADPTLVDSLILNMEEVQRLMAEELVALEGGVGDDDNARAAATEDCRRQHSFSRVFGEEDEGENPQDEDEVSESCDASTASQF